MMSCRLLRGWMLAMALCVLFATGAVLIAARPAAAEWRSHAGWGPFPPAYPYPHDAIAAGVAAGVAGMAAGSVLNNVLGEPQDQPYAPPSSVYVSPPATGTVSAPGPLIHAGSYGPATLPPRWDPDCSQQVAPSGVYVNGRPQMPPC